MGAVAPVLRHGEGGNRCEPDVASEEKGDICDAKQAKCNNRGAGVAVEKRYIEKCQDLRWLIELRFGRSQEARPVRWLGKSRNQEMSQHLRFLGHVLPERRGIRRVSGFFVRESTCPTSFTPQICIHGEALASKLFPGSYPVPPYGKQMPEVGRPAVRTVERAYQIGGQSTGTWDCKRQKRGASAILGCITPFQFQSLVVLSSLRPFLAPRCGHAEAEGDH